MNNHDKDASTTGLIVLPQSSDSILEPYSTLNRRQFLVRSSLLAAASSVLILPKTLRATGLILPSERNTELMILNNIIGFNGERRDPLTNLYHLGQGYRAYNPALMRFHAADSLSPFGEGGLNAYAYTLGNPINMIDPSGHFSFFSIFKKVVGLVLSAATLVVGIMTFNPVLIVSSTLSVGASATGIASTILEKSNPEAAAVLGYVSTGLSVASTLTGMASSTSAGKNMISAGSKKSRKKQSNLSAKKR